jgi:hypothetical protein
MKFSKSIIIKVLFVISMLPLVVSCGPGGGSNLIIIGRATETDLKSDLIYPSEWRYSEGSSLIALESGRKQKVPRLLTGDFSSACSPSASYDGRKIVFAGKLKNEDPWQVWEMKISNRKYRRVTESGSNCIDPVYLPGGRIAYSRQEKNDTSGLAYHIYTCAPDGSDQRQITFHPHHDYNLAILADGRILCSTMQAYPENGRSYLMVMRPDGTKADRFYHGADEGEITGRISEMPDGRIFYVETDKDNPGTGKLFSLFLNRPLGSKTSVGSGVKGSFNSVSGQLSGKLLVALKPEGKENYGVYEIDASGNSEPVLIYEDPDHNVTSALFAEAVPLAKKLPSEVDMHVKTGQIMCQDINICGPETKKNMKPGYRAGKIEVLGIGKSLGTVEVEEDGSFYLKPLADMPFRIQTIDETGKVINGPSGWISLRPNERRGCVGCHEDPELVPDNLIPLAVKKRPVIIPAQISKIKEKTVELE